MPPSDWQAADGDKYPVIQRDVLRQALEGEVISGQKYIVVDDALTMGGTIASLRGYIENNGGKVMATSVMTVREGTLDWRSSPRYLRTSMRNTVQHWMHFGRRLLAMA